MGRKGSAGSPEDSLDSPGIKRMAVKPNHSIGPADTHYGTQSPPFDRKSYKRQYTDAALNSDPMVHLNISQD
jgi:hypothetical protein